MHLSPSQSLNSTPQRSWIRSSVLVALRTWPHSSRWLLALLLAFTSAGPAWAQKPTPGDWYEETAQLGFRVKTPKDWTFVPPQPKETVQMAKYVPNNRDYLPLGGDDRLYVFCWILKFDLELEHEQQVEQELMKRRFATGEEVSDEERAEIEATPVSMEDLLTQWIEVNTPQGNGFKVTEKSPLKVGKTPAEEWTFEGSVRSYNREDTLYPVNVYAAIYEVAPNQRVVMAFNSSGDKKDWGKYESSYKKLGHSFQKLDLATPETKEAVAEGDLRGKKRAELEASIATMPGWWIQETLNYFILTDSDDKRFIDEIAVRLEAIRGIYERDYPADKARAVAESPQTGAGQNGPSPGDQDGEQDPPAEETGDRSVAKKKHLEMSRTSVVRICSDQDMYFSYGGPGGSAGYWNSYTQELVLYDDKQGGGRSDTYSVLNHEAFHQYIFYFYGSLAPHSWYNEGTGDFYSGYKFNIKRKKFELEPFDWRTGTIKEALRKDIQVPLKTFMRFTQGEYYGNNKLGATIGDNYAQGWSLIWFLRNGKGKPKGWQDSWGSILETYLATLAATGDLDEAVNKALAGVDMKQLEECWKRYIE